MSYRASALGQEFGVRLGGGSGQPSGMPSIAAVAQHTRYLREQRVRAELTALLQKSSGPSVMPLRSAYAAFETAFPPTRFTYADPRVGYQLDARYWPASRIQAIEALTGMTLAARDVAILRDRGLNAPGEVDGQAAASLPSHRRPLEAPLPIYALFQSADQLMATMPDQLDTMQGAAWLKNFMATFHPMIGTASPSSTQPSRRDAQEQGSRRDAQQDSGLPPRDQGTSKTPWALIVGGVFVVGASAWWLMRRGR